MELISSTSVRPPLMLYEVGEEKVREMTFKKESDRTPDGEFSNSSMHLCNSRWNQKRLW